jgi:hypothetical protein
LTEQSFIHVHVLPVHRFQLYLLKELQKMIKFRSHALMTNILDVTAELLNGVCVVIAAVAFELRDVVIVVVC